MLLQSQEVWYDAKFPGEDRYTINLLPALPSIWKEGSMKGLRARGGFELDIQWKEHKLVKATVKSLNGKSCKVRYGAKEIKLNIEKGKSVVLDVDLVTKK